MENRFQNYSLRQLSKVMKVSSFLSFNNNESNPYTK